MPGRQALRSHLIFLTLLLVRVTGAMAGEDGMPQGYHLVRDCREEWLVYSPEYKNYVPYVKAVHESEPSVSILLNLVQDRHFTFLLKTGKEAFLFADGALRKHLYPGQWAVVSCDSLYREYGKTEILFTVFGLHGTEGLTSLMAFPGTGVAADSVQALSRSLVSLKPRSENIFRDFSVMAWLLILVAGAVVFLSVPTIAYKIASPVAFFSRDFRSELYNHYRAYSPPIVVAVAVLALITAFALLVVERYVAPVLPPVLGISGSGSVWSLTAGYLKIALLCFVLFYFKYFVIFVTLGILNMTGIAHIHFIKAVQSSILFYGLMAGGLLILVLQAPASLPDLGVPLLWGISVYYGIRYILLYIVLNQTGRIINLYLISYLCVVELIPLIIGIKYLM